MIKKRNLLRRKGRFAVRLLPLGLLALILGMRILFPEAVEEFQVRTFDKFQRSKPRVYREAPVLIADIDDETLSKIGQWPWPRTQVAELIRKLHQAGAAVICLDIVFAEPDRTSPARILPFWPKTPEIENLASRAKELPDHDEVLAKAMAEARVVTGFTLSARNTGARPVLKAGFAYAGDDPLPYLKRFDGVVANLPALEKAAKGNGTFNFIPERDGIIRRIPSVFRFQDSLVPSLVMESLRVAQEASTYIVKSSSASGETSFGEHSGLISVKVGNLVVPTDNEGRIWLYDTGYQPKRFLPAWKILAGDFDPASVEGKIVFVGSSAAGIKDLRATPLDPVAAGTEVHAQLAEQILTEEFLYRPDVVIGAEILYVLVLGLALIFLLPQLGAAACAGMAVLTFAGAVGFSWYAFSARHWLVDPVLPCVSVLLIYLAVSFANFLRAEADKKQVRSAFGRYVSPAFVKQLAENPDQLRLGGETKNMTILFTDIRGFTTLSEKFSAQELTHFINRFLTPMTDIVLQNQGTIDKYMGDCIMAFWNAPLDVPDHPRRGAEAALAMRNHLAVWNEEMKKEFEDKKSFFTPIRVGIGINTGNCCVGNMGSDQRFDYSVLGDEVNLASRLEGLSSTYGLDILIGPNMNECIAQDFATLEIDLIQVKGKTKPVRIYGLLGEKDLKTLPQFQKLNSLQREMLEAYRGRDWEMAKQKITECLKTGFAGLNLQTLYQVYSERITAYATHPPAPDWAGVAVAISK